MRFRYKTRLHPTAGPWPPDVEHWVWAGASVAGTAHLKAGTKRQDAFRCLADRASGTLVCVVSDGAGSAEFGGQGAALTCRIVSEAALRHARSTSDAPSDQAILAWIDHARDSIAFAAETRAKAKRDFAATLVAVIARPNGAVIVQIGDGCAAVREPSGDWSIPLMPDHGEYVSMTRFVTDDPTPACRISRVGSPLSSVAVLTDGLERLAIDFSSGAPFSGFFNGVLRPVLQSPTTTGRDADLSASLREFLGSSAVCERTDDDKTLVVAAKR